MYSKAFLGKRAEDLSNIIEQQTQPIFDELKIIVPITSCSTVLTLKKLKTASLVEIARELEQSHQLVKQKLPKLERLGLISKSPDKLDKRKTNYKLTPKGIEQSKKIESYLVVSEKLVQTVSNEIENDVAQIVNDALSALRYKTLLERYREYNQ
ncbi:MAG: winged helix-turn-helix transcriptional regulator [Kangiellaceae bacterium]|nr:winged helix-turn-helix transcriptional regulator [Kangiellaceae bacterium]